MRRFTIVAILLGFFSVASSLVFSEDHNDDAGEGGSPGIDSAWDHESINVLDGNVHLSIPLYSIRTGQDFGFSVNLQYNSKVWDAADSNFPNTPSNRSLVAKSVVGLGWKIHFGRIYSLNYTNGANSEIFYYFEAPDGSTHRLYAIPTAAEACTATPYWYAHDGSGIRAQFSAPGAPSPTGSWKVWMSSGTILELSHFVAENPGAQNTPEQVNYKGWYTTFLKTTVERPSGGPMHYVMIYYAPASDTPRRYCPMSISDELGRSVTFDCQATTADGTVVDGGIIRAITVPAPPASNGAPRTLTYQLDYAVLGISDPFTCPDDFPCVTKPGVPLLAKITALGVTPTHEFTFGYQVGALEPVFPPGPGTTFGELTGAVLPGGAKRLYSYGTYNVWRKDYPITYGSTAAPQFAYFPIRGLVSRQTQVDGTTWRWDYQRLNDPACAASGAALLNCADHPVSCQVTGPYRVGDATVLGSSTVYNYNVTKASAGTPGPKDGTVDHVEVYAGPPNAARKLRTLSYVYDYDPPGVGCSFENFMKGHYVEKLRVTDNLLSFDDDGKTPNDVRRIQSVDWRSTSPNSGRFLETWDYKADGTTVYRKTINGPPPPSPPPAIPPISLYSWTRTVQVEGGAETVLAETDFTFDQYGRTQSSRRLYAPSTITSNDVLTTYAYNDSVDGNLSQIDTRIPGRPESFTQYLAWQQGGYLSRRTLSGNPWYAFDSDRDVFTGLPTQVRKPWKTGVRINYDLLGRMENVLPLTGSGDPPVSFSYSAGQVTTTVGDPASPQTQIRSQSLFDGLGRLKEERILKYDDLGSDQWVARSYTRDIVGNVSSRTEWAPVGSISVPATSFFRSGTYAGGIQAFDPFFRVRQVVNPEGDPAIYSYQGLVSTLSISGIQGGSAGSPLLITSVTTSTSDIHGRLIQTQTCDAAGCAANQPVIKQTYDALDRPLITTTNDAQPRSKSYDPLSRLTVLSEPERGTIWFGSHHLDGSVDPDGYNALGEVIRYQDAAGYATIPTSYHYVLTYDSAGRLRMTEKEPDPSGTRDLISEHFFDLSDHGNGAYSYLGRLGRTKGYDELGRVVEQTDYYYQDPFGRLSQQTMVFGLWDGTPGVSGTDATYNLFYDYDALGQVASLTYPTTGVAGPSSGSTYLSFTRTHGLIKSVQSNRGTQIVTNALYNDALGLKEWDAPSGLRTQIIPDDPIRSRTREVKVTTAGGAQIWSTGTYSYDAAGHIIEIGSDYFWYDALGRLANSDVNGTTPGVFHNQGFTYDAFGSLTTRTDTTPGPGGSPLSTILTYTLDSYPNPTVKNQVVGTNGVTSWTYLANGALSDDGTFTYTYDNAGRLMEMTRKATSEQVGKYYYNGSGLRTVRQENHGKEVFSLRDPDGNVLSQFSRPAGTNLTPQWERDFVYFGGTRVSMIEKPSPPAVAWKFTKSVNSNPGAGISLEWYPTGGADTYGFLVFRKSPGPSTFTPLYVSSPTQTTSGATTIYLDPASGLIGGSTYTYKVVAIDSAGNQGPDSAERIITFQDSVDPYPPTDLQATPGNENVTISWTAPAGVPDLAGYYIYKKTNGSYGSPINALPITGTYYYDLNVVNGTTYKYVVKATDTANRQSAASNEVTATPASPGSGGGNGNGGGGVNPRDRGALEQMYPWEEEKACGIAEGSEIAPYRTIGQAVSVRILFLHSDHLGSLRLVTDLWGQAVSNHKYLPFGEEIEPMHTLDPFRYAGYERDSESGMDYVRARYYSPNRSRWLSADPLGHGYGYAIGNPVWFKDPSGLDVCLVMVCATDAGCGSPHYVACGNSFPTIPDDWNVVPGGGALIADGPPGTSITTPPPPPPPQKETDPCANQGFAAYAKEQAEASDYASGILGLAGFGLAVLTPPVEAAGVAYAGVIEASDLLLAGSGGMQANALVWNGAALGADFSHDNIGDFTQSWIEFASGKIMTNMVQGAYTGADKGTQLMAESLADTAAEEAAQKWRNTVDSAPPPCP